jgi:hypothetical protein
LSAILNAVITVTQTTDAGDAARLSSLSFVRTDIHGVLQLSIKFRPHIIRGHIIIINIANSFAFVDTFIGAAAPRSLSRRVPRSLSRLKIETMKPAISKDAQIAINIPRFDELRYFPQKNVAQVIDLVVEAWVELNEWCEWGVYKVLNTSSTDLPITSLKSQWPSENTISFGNVPVNRNSGARLALVLVVGPSAVAA